MSTLPPPIGCEQSSAMKGRENHNIPHIPDDILANILKRLPLKSLIRFQCVSKDWKNLIKSPSFIQDCLHHTSRPTPLLLHSFHSLTSRHRFQFLDPRSKQVLEIQNPPLIDSCFKFDIVGSCNGLVCLRVFNGYNALSPPCFLLWNPWTRQFREVLGTSEDFNVRQCLGFGFNPIDNDYKILKLRSDFAVNPVEVYSLNSGSWKQVEFENLEGTITISCWKNVTVNGVVYWLGGKQRPSEDYDHSLLVSIDLKSQKCTSIPLPDLGSEESIRLKLSLYENKPAVLDITDSSLIHLWVMEEDTCASRGKWIWTKKYTCSFCPTRLPPHELNNLNAIAIWKNEIVCRPFIWRNHETKRFCLLDLTTNEFKEFVISCGRYSAYGMCNYVESHVSVDTHKP